MLATFDPHPIRVTLRQDILRHLHRKGWKRKDLARESKLEAVTVSNLLNNKQSFMLYQLDAFTEALGLPAGHFYSYFKAECCNDEGRIRPGKCGGFAVRCLAVDQEKVIQDLLHLLSEDSNVTRQATILLDIAEHIYHSPLRAKALFYYEKVVKREEKISERYAICQYRRFLLIREQGTHSQVVQAFHQFTPHLHRLPTNLQREAYRHVLLYVSLVEEWHSLLPYAKEMEESARDTMDTLYDATNVAEALYYQAIALRGLGKLGEAWEKTNEYAVLHPDYAKIAETNRALLAIQMGDRDEIPIRHDHATSQVEVYERLLTVLEVYTNKGMIEKVGNCLAEYATEVTELCQLSLNDPLIRYAIHLRSLRVAYFSQVEEKAKALEEIHIMLDIAEQTGNMGMLKRHTARFLNMQLKGGSPL